MCDWLSGIQQRESLAKLEAMKRRSDEYHESQKPIHELAGRVMPLLRDAELSMGKRPSVVYLPQSDYDALVKAGLATMEHFGEYLGEPAMLLGLRIEHGDELRVA